jgi:hypothetical protein
MILSSLNLVKKIGVCITSEENGESKFTSEKIVIYIISGIKCTTFYLRLLIINKKNQFLAKTLNLTFTKIYFDNC